MMVILEATEGVPCPGPNGDTPPATIIHGLWKEVPDMRTRDRADAVRRLGQAGMEGTFLAFPEKYLEQVIEMERAQITKEVVREKQAELAVHHVDNAAGAAEVAATLSSALPACGTPLVADLGPVLGVHLGPGAVGVVVCLSG